jgi:hypothetical protein
MIESNIAEAVPVQEQFSVNEWEWNGSFWWSTIFIALFQRVDLILEISGISEPSFWQFFPRAVTLRLVRWRFGLTWNLVTFWVFLWKRWTVCFWVNQFRLGIISVRTIGIAETNPNWISEWLWSLTLGEGFLNCNWIFLALHSQMDHESASPFPFQTSWILRLFQIFTSLVSFLWIEISAAMWWPGKHIDHDFGHEMECFEWFHPVR